MALVLFLARSETISHHLVKVVGSSAIDSGLIPGSSKLGQKSVVAQEIANSAIFLFFKNLKF